MGVNMKINVKSININYIQYGEGSDVVLLHGWGQNIEMMKPLGDKLSKNHKITIIDLPGFGETAEPEEELTIDDYSNILEEFLNKLKIKNPILIGHSFGGRISMIYAACNKVEKLVLFGSPCIARKTKLTLKVRILKFLKKVPLINKFENFAKKHIGSRDYKNASNMMRKILVNTVNADLSEYCKKIKCPTLLIWGENDSEVDVSEAREIESMINDAGLVVLPNSSHYAYLENLNHVTNILRNFL